MYALYDDWVWRRTMEFRNCVGRNGVKGFLQIWSVTSVADDLTSLDADAETMERMSKSLKRRLEGPERHGVFTSLKEMKSFRLA